MTLSRGLVLPEAISDEISFYFIGECEAPRPQAGASRKGNIVLIVPLNPAYKAGLAGHLPAKARREPGLSAIRYGRLFAEDDFILW
jgi:hypothetical protein